MHILYRKTERIYAFSAYTFEVEIGKRKLQGEVTKRQRDDWVAALKDNRGNVLIRAFDRQRGTAVERAIAGGLIDLLPLDWIVDAVEYEMEEAARP